MYLRHNLSQAAVAELFGSSQPTAFRLIGRLALTITRVLTDHADRITTQALHLTAALNRTHRRVPHIDQRHLHLGHVLR
jgi:hypothetical protein